MVTRRQVIGGAAASAVGIALGGERAGAQDTTVPGAGLGGKLVVYSGRAEEYVADLATHFQDATGIAVEMRYGPAAERAATLLEEGNNSPADLYLTLDAASVGAVSAAGRLAKLPPTILDRVDPRYRADDGTWVATSARVRTLAYNTVLVDPATLPTTVFGLVDDRFAGKIGWAPENASFLAFLTAMRVVHGDDATREWLQGMREIGVVGFEGNGAMVKAVAAGEIELGLVNHYYVYEIEAEEGADIPVAMQYFAGDDVGSLVSLCGAGVVSTAGNRAQAEAFIAFMLTDPEQQFLATERWEYPVVAGIGALPDLKPLAEIPGPPVDTSALTDLPGTLALLAEVGII